MTKREILREVYLTEKTFLFNYCFKLLRNAASAEDAVQTVFERALANESQFATVAICRRYIVAACRNECATRIRRLYREWSLKDRYRIEQQRQLAIQADLLFEKQQHEKRLQYFRSTVLPILKKACKKNGPPLAVVMSQKWGAFSEYARESSLPYSTVRSRYLRILETVREQLKKLIEAENR